MRVLSNKGSGPDEGFDEQDLAFDNPLVPVRTPSRSAPDPVRIAILLAVLVIIALVTSIIIVSLRQRPAEVVQATASQQTEPPDDTAVSAAIDEDLRVPAMFATQFAHSYLNFTEEDPDKRAATLEQFLAPGLDPQLGWSGSGIQAAGVLMPLQADRDGQRITVTVAAFVSGSPYSRWIHLAVPLAQDADGSLAVVGTPAYVPAPTPADVDPLPVPDGDDELSAQLRPLVAAAMEAYGASDTIAVSGITAPGSAVPGLGGLYSMTALESLVVTGRGDARTAFATVSWDTDAIGGPLLQDYQLDLVRLDGAWVVEHIGPR